MMDVRRAIDRRGGEGCRLTHYLVLDNQTSSGERQGFYHIQGMEISQLGSTLWVLVAALLLVVLPAAHATNWPHGIVSFPNKPMVLPAIVLPPITIHVPDGYFNPHQRVLSFAPPVFHGPMVKKIWIPPPPPPPPPPPMGYVNPPNRYYSNQWHVPKIVPNYIRYRPFNVKNAPFKMQTNVPRVSKPTFKAFTNAPVYKTVSSVPKRKKTRISVMSDPLVDVRPSPVHNSMKHHMRKKAMYKSVAKAKPFRHILSGTALGLNKV